VPVVAPTGTKDQSITGNSKNIFELVKDILATLKKLIAMNE
jgi:hypothetical protein